MLGKFNDHIARHNLFDRADRVLLAVSGGLDSMVMLDLFRKGDYSIGVAHCNFGLRGPESDGDEEFVKDYCSHAGVPFYSRTFTIKNYAEETGLSIQMAARELRYAWFSSLMELEGFHWLATAHHHNDNLETVIMRWIHGGGVDQLAGIPLKHSKIIRPMLFATRDEIQAHAAANRIAWREDSSNVGDDYQRNFIRHHILPVLKEVNPSLEDTFRVSLEKIGGGLEMMQRGLAQMKDSITRLEGNNFLIDKSLLMLVQHPAFVCYEWLRPYGFEWTRCQQLVESLSGQPGKQFLSATHRAVIDRESVIVSPLTRELKTILIEEGQDKTILGPWTLVINFSHDKNYADDVNLATVDAAKVKFPLVWRKWQSGDTFFPLGMKQRKKLSDFLVDEKVPRHEKNEVTVLESGGEVMWVVGHRMDNRFKVTSGTKSVFHLRVNRTY